MPSLPPGFRSAPPLQFHKDLLGAAKPAQVVSSVLACFGQGVLRGGEPEAEPGWQVTRWLVPRAAGEGMETLRQET